MIRIILSVLAITLFITSFVLANEHQWMAIDDLLKEREFDKAKVITESLIEDEQGRKQYYQGRIALTEGEEKQAIKLIKKAAKKDPNNADYQAWLGMAYGARALSASLFGKASAAGNSRKSFVRSLELDPDNIIALTGLSGFYAQAPGIVGGDKDEALVLAKHLIELDFGIGSGALIQTYLAREELAEATLVADNWLEKGEDKKQAYMGNLNFYARQDNWDKCFSLLDDWKNNFATDSRFLYLTGAIAVLADQRLEQGLTALQNYLTQTDLDEDFSPHWTHFRIGQIHQKLGRLGAAKLAYQTALESEPEFEQAQDALKNLDS